jgi:hypothetical protein
LVLRQQEANRILRNLEVQTNNKMSDCDFDCASATESSSHNDDDQLLPFALVDEPRPTRKQDDDDDDDENAAVPSRAAAAPPTAGRPSSFAFGKVLHDPQQQHGPSKKSSSCSSLFFNGQASSQLSSCSSSLPPQMVTSSILSSPTTVNDGGGETSSSHHHHSSSSHFGNSASSILLRSSSLSSVNDNRFSSHYLDAAASLLLPHHHNHNGGSSDADSNITNFMHAQSDMAFSHLLSQAESSSSSNPNMAAPIAAHHHHTAAVRPFSGGASTTAAYLPPLLEEASYNAAATSTSGSSVLSSSYFTLPDAYSFHPEPSLQQEQQAQQRGCMTTNDATLDHKNIQNQQCGGGNWLSRNLLSLSPDVVAPSDPLSTLQQQQQAQQQLEQTIVPEASDASILREHKRHQYRLRQQQQQSSQEGNTCSRGNAAAAGGGPSQRGLASLAGATARMTGELSFEVSIDLVVPNCTVADVMDIVGNPDMLHLWCDAVSSLIITSISEGAQDAPSRRRRIHSATTTAFTEQGDNDAPQRPQQKDSYREYHGEWIEATTSQLMTPVNALSCIYSTSRMLRTAMGFPTYGKITMFVERHRGHVGLTMGPLPGGYEILHRINVETVTGVDRRIRMTDQVRLQTNNLDSASPCAIAAANATFCGLFSVFERCFLPTPEDYMDQVLNSMARLRFLVENGEETDCIMSHFHHPLQENGGNAMTAPLLTA